MPARHAYYPSRSEARSQRKAARAAPAPAPLPEGVRHTCSAALALLCLALVLAFFVRSSPALRPLAMSPMAGVQVEPAAPARAALAEPAGAPLPSAAATAAPPPAPAPAPAPTLLPEDAAYAARLEALLALDGDPWDRARDAWERGRVWPATFVRSATLFAPRPPATLAETLAPAALAALVANKTHDVSKIMPGNAETAIFKYEQEMEYYAEYASSWRAWTWAKGGVDCNRHLEIVCNGVIPLFRGIRAVASPTTLYNYPRHLLAFFEDEQGDMDVRHLATMRHFMLHWAHRHLSAPSSVDYMMRAADHTALALGLQPLFSRGAAATAPPPPPRIAFIDSSLPQAVDYMSNFLLLGLVERLGADSVDIFYPVPYMYKGGPDIDGRGYVLYGLGYGLRHRLARPAVQPELAEMVARLHAGAYAAVVWGSFTRSTAHLHEPETVAAYNLQPHRLWLVDGHDAYGGWPAGASGPWAHLRLNASCFIREHVVIPYP
jgi:hypothetical protein